MFGGTRPAAVPERLMQSPARSPRLPRSPRLGHRRSNSGGDSSGTGHTLSMENIQSLNAAYATSGPTYFSDFDSGLQATALPGKGVLTLGRAPGGGSRLVYPVGGGSRVTTMGSSPNIPAASSGMDASLYQVTELGRRDNQLEFQTQIKEMVRENELLRKELEVKDSKLGSSMNSIRTFWSPELKKERALRKDEVSRIAVLREQLRVTHDDSQGLQLTVHALQDELRVQRDLAQLLQGEVAGRGTSLVVMGGGIGDKLPSEESVQRLRAEHERQAKELYLLRQTLEEMELRIEAQKQTLNSRDESIRKLLEMLQQGSGGRTHAHGGDEPDGEYGGVDGDGIRHLAEAESQIARLESLLEHRERENQQFREEIQRRSESVLDGGKTKALHTVIEMKDTKIASLEQGMRDLEDEIQTLRSSGALSLEEREEEMKQIEVYKSHSKFMKNKEGHAEAGRMNEQSERVRQLEGELVRRKDEAGRAQTEVDRLLDILRQTETEKHDKDMKIAELERHFKEKGKKVSGLKQKEAAERRHALPDEAQGREAGTVDNGLHLQESLRQRDERIKELEEALRESIHISTEREMLLSQEQSQCNSALKQVEELEALLERSRQEVESTRARLSSTQRSLAEREARLTSLRAERRRQLEEVLEMKQEALLAAISEKDANIALLELSASKRKKTQEEVAALKREKDRLVQQLKQQTQNRMKLMADCYEDDERQAVRAQPVSQGSSADQMIQSLRRVHNEQEKLRLYIEHLVLLCEQRDPQTLMGLHGLPLEPGDYVGAADNAVNLAVGEALEGAVGTDGDKNRPARNLEQVAEELERGQQRAASLQELANALLQRISERCPDLLEQVVRALEEVE
uniref:ELKS/Rab6-interacting/CAST family member 1-like n=1 Tax=Myxine glutinosa TaxID=7769 RepID=UPI00358EF874